MSAQLEGAVREALEDLASSAAPPDLTRGAINRANRQRAARLSVAGLAAVAAAIVAVPMVAGGLAGPDDPLAAGAGQPGSVKPFVVTAYSGVNGTADVGTADDYSLLLDPATGTYEKVPYNEAVPSPDGSQVLVHEGDNSTAHPSRRGLMDRASGKVRWLPGNFGYTDGATWSPDGTQILISNKPKVTTDPGHGFLLVDAETLAIRLVGSPDINSRNAVGANFVWTPQGKELALVHTTNPTGAGPAEVTGIGYYDLAGKLTRTVPVTNGLLGDGAQFSPDGSRIALDEPPGSDDIRIVDVATGIVHQQFSVPTAGRVLGWYDSSHLIVYDYGDPDLTERPSVKVVDLAGKVTRTVPFAEGAESAQRVYLGASASLQTGVEKLAF
ncbi:hypothetical protein [Micromonospora sp. NBC_01412]|uniref:TolB family protein n=1 Tax=Micromonospora sp. NBC_01412 TaxID=2903590 RepID=UPI0032520488